MVVGKFEKFTGFVYRTAKLFSSNLTIQIILILKTFKLLLKIYIFASMV